MPQTYLYGSHIDGIICVKQMGFKDIIFFKMSSDLNFIVTSRFLEYVLVKPYFNTQFPPPPGSDGLGVGKGGYLGRNHQLKDVFGANPQCHEL